MNPLARQNIALIYKILETKEICREINVNIGSIDEDLVPQILEWHQ